MLRKKKNKDIDDVIDKPLEASAESVENVDNVEGAESAESAENAEPPLIECDGLVKLYKTDEVEVFALQGLDLVINKGELMAVIGKSGSGKSTLLNIIGALEHPSAGRILIKGKDISKMSEDELVELRRHTIGFVWQRASQNLFPYMTARENIEAQLYFEKSTAAGRRRIPIRTRCPVVSSRELRSRFRWLRIRRYFLRMSRREPLIRKPPTGYRLCSDVSTRREA